MSHRAFTQIRIVTAALLLAAAPAANAVLYTWLNDDDTTTYSDQPPPDPAEVRDFTRIEQSVPSRPAETAQKESIDVQREKSGSDSAVVKGGEAPPRAVVRPDLPLAVQDPCLMSSDRYCYQKNSVNYRPHVGYSPGGPAVAETPQAGALSATGATGGAGGGGSVGSGSTALQNVLPPPRRSSSTYSATKP